MTRSTSTPGTLTSIALDTLHSPKFCSTPGNTTSDIQEDMDFDPVPEDMVFEHNDHSISDYDEAEEEAEIFESMQPKIADLMVKQFNVNREQVKVEYMQGGSFNRIAGITIAPKPAKTLMQWLTLLFSSWRSNISTKDSGPETIKPRFWDWLKALFVGGQTNVLTTQAGTYVVRTPRHTEMLTEEDVEDVVGPDVTILKCVGASLNVPVPKVIDYSLSLQNVLEQPYMVLDRLPGQSLGDLWETLNIAQKKSVAKRLIDLLSEIAAVEAPPGNIIASKTGVAQELITEKYCVPPRGSKVKNFVKPKTWVADYQTAAEHLLEQCDRWREYQTIDGWCFKNIWFGFSAIARSLQRRGFLEGPCVLVHADLREYNMLAEVRSDTEVEITGILDWDSAIVAPEFMAYRAPFWMWLPVDMESVTANGEDKANFEPVTNEDREVKQFFVDNASAKYNRYAFAPEAMLARRMYVLLKDGVFGTWEFDEATKVIQEWDILHPEDLVVLEESDSEFSSDDDSDDES
ncbi:hypothetical protein ACN47E_001631 [Coniothyrium glycines]